MMRGDGRWRHRSAVGRFRPRCLVGRVRASGGKSGVMMASKLGFTFLLLFAVIAAAQQDSATPGGNTSRQSSNPESQSAPCPPDTGPDLDATPSFDPCKYAKLGPGVQPPPALSAPAPIYP